MNIPGTGLSANLSGAGMGKDSGSTTSTTTAGISGMAGDIAKRTGDNAQGIGKIFDADKVRQEIEAQTKITQEFSKQASTAIESDTHTQRKALQDQATQVEKTGTTEEKAQAQQALCHPPKLIDIHLRSRTISCRFLIAQTTTAQYAPRTAIPQHTKLRDPHR